jgi:nucleoside-diphosphate-sugar epimerase
MKYLVLGSSGQIGYPLCNFLRKLGHKVLEFDVVEDELEDLRTHNNELLDKYVKESDFVFFLAFDVGGSRYLTKYQHTFNFFHNNVKLMSNTFQILKKHNKPFIFASSQMSNMSYSPYGVAKAAGERYTDSLNGLTVKFWNVYGPERDLEKAHVITDFILKAKNTGIIDMLSDGTEVRQFLHADDCSKCLLALSEKYDVLDKSKEYHVTNFEWTSVLKIAEIIASKFEGTKVIPAEQKDLLQKDRRNEADTHILNFWKPKISIEEGINMIIEELK